MDLETSINVANTLKRPYDVTFPVNAPTSLMPTNDEINFPNITPSDELVIKRSFTEVNGKQGTFFGLHNTKTGLPSGCGVFRNKDWFSVGCVNGSEFAAGRRVNVNRRMKILQLVKTNYHSDGSKREKIETYSP